MLFLVAALAGLGSSAGAEAKVTCAPSPSGSKVVLDGAPAEPVAAVSYDVGVTTSRRYKVRPQPLLFLKLCGASAELDVQEQLDLPITERSGDRVRSEFKLTFPRPGRWQVALMDLSGQFHALGPYVVRSTPREADSTTESAAKMPALFAGGGALLLAALLVAARTLRVRAR